MQWSISQLTSALLLLHPLTAVADSAPKYGHSHGSKTQLAVIMVDGGRWDYVDRYKADLPAFRRLLSEGVKAEWVETIFPALSYPNWQTLSTGLYPESHEILSNQMFDVHETNLTLAKFDFDDPKTTYFPKWWQKSEPIWITSTKHGKKTFLRHWSRCDVPFNGSRPTACVGYGGEGGTAGAGETIKLVGTKLVEGFELVMVHVDFIDHAGHHGGPDSEEVKEALMSLDGFVGSVLEKLDEAKLSKTVNLIVTSDHGMTHVGSGSGAQFINLRQHVDWNLINKTVSFGAAMQIIPATGSLEQVYNRLKEVEGLRVYKREEIPQNWHYKGGRYVLDLLLVSDAGFLIREAGSSGPGGGTHGYPPEMADMRALFIARGPAFKTNHVGPPIKMVDIYQLYTIILGIPAQPHNGTFEHVSPLLASPGGGTAVTVAVSSIARLVINGQPVCGATILQRDWVLTAARCVVGRNKDEMSVVAGFHNTTIKAKTQQQVKVKEIIIHQRFEYNIAVLRVAPSFKFGPKIAPANLQPCDAPAVAGEGILAGWGSVKSNASRAKRSDTNPDNLSTAETNILSHDVCKQKVPKAGWLQICALGPSCVGDPGGPLFVTLNNFTMQVGLLSFIEGDCDSGTAVYTKLSAYAGWLNRRTSGCGNYPYYTHA